jgi:S-(hydroxymethyl)glutathione dehydrogenase/alcohol dehydrogenase
MRVRAAVLRRMGDPLTVEQVELEPPRAGEVLVQVAAAGVCHSDVHLADGHLGRERQPIVLGHEGAGVVEAVGAGVDRVAPGDRIGFCFVASCGECARCRGGQPNLCLPANQANSRGYLLDGTTRIALADGTPVRHFLGVSCFAERCVVSAASAIPVPDALPLWQAALVGCSVVTGMGAVRNAAAVRPGQSVVVIGCGGVGLQVASAAKLAGADPLIAVDRDADKLQRARDRGATDAVQVSETCGGAVAKVKEICDGGADVAIEVVGSPETIHQAFELIRPGGVAVVVGIAPHGEQVSLPALDFIDQKTIRGSFYGSADPGAEMPELLEMVADGRLDVAGAVSSFTDLNGIEAAFQRLRRGEGARTVAVIVRELAGVET